MRPWLGVLMFAKDIAKIVWRWRNVARQAVADYHCHAHYPGLPRSRARRYLEQQRLLWSNRVRAADYYALGLSDPAMPWATKRRYIGGYESWRLFLPMNPQSTHDLMDKKLRFRTAAAEAGLPVGEVLAVVTQHPDEHPYPVLRTEQELRSWLLDNAVSDIVIKPVDGTKGWGVMSLGQRAAGQEAWVRLPGTETINIAALWTHCTRYLYRGGVIVERRLAPHPALAAVMPNVLHTVRAVTYLKPEPRILAAALRVGLGSGPADNLAQGGIVVPIDLEGGICGRGSLLVNGVPQFIDEHPVTGTRITGLVLPHWNEARDLARRAAQAFPMFKSIGWDVALSARGPILLEGNWCYDLAVNQIAGRRGILDTQWLDLFNETGAYRHLGLGFTNRPKAPARIVGTGRAAGSAVAS